MASAMPSSGPTAAPPPSASRSIRSVRPGHPASNGIVTTAASERSTAAAAAWFWGTGSASRRWHASRLSPRQGDTAMPYAHVSPRPSSLRRAIVPAFVFTLLPLAAAFAQSHVRVTKDGTEISSLRGWKEVRMTAPRGTVLEVMVIDGDRYKHLDRNWYWVLLPEDASGTRPVGWIRGDAVEHAPAPVAAAGRHAAAGLATPDPSARTEPREVVVPSRATGDNAAETRPARAFASDVVITFEF